MLPPSFKCFSALTCYVLFWVDASTCVCVCVCACVCVYVSVCVLFCMPFFSVSCCVLVLKLFFFSTCRNTPFVVCPFIPARSPSFYLGLLSVCAEARLCYFPECVCICVCVSVWVCVFALDCVCRLILPALWRPLSCVRCHFLFNSTFPLFPYCPTFCHRPLLFLSLSTVCSSVHSCALLIFLKPPPFTPGASLVVFVFVLIVAGPPHVWSGL